MVRSSVLVLVAGLALAGCGGSDGGRDEPGGGLAAFQGPIRSSNVAHGQELYDGICMSCHGGGAPELANLGWEVAAMRRQVRQGEGRMPAIAESRLSADDLEAVLAYMTTIGSVRDEQASSGGEEAPAEGDEGTSSP